MSENLNEIIRKAEELEQMRLGLLKKPAPEEDDYEYISFRRRPGIFAILQRWDHVVDQI